MNKHIITFQIILMILFVSSFRINAQDKKEIDISPHINDKRVPISMMAKTLPTDVQNPLETEINYTTLGIISGITLGIGTAVHLYQANAWWQKQGSEFKIVNDWKYALWLDKAGHFYATSLIAHGLSAGLEQANMTIEESAVYGAIGAFAFQTFVEIEDGYGLNWGFSPGDWAADFLGALYTVGQYYYPTLKHIQPRVSYFPSKDYREGKHDGTISDDYKGQKVWLGFRMKQLLPKTISKYWPEFLMVSVGMGLRNWNGFGGGFRDIYIALDFDAETIPLYGPTWQFIKNTLNYIHFPMPGIRISNDTAAFIIVF